MICGIDGGRPPKTVWAWVDPELDLQTSRVPPTGLFELVIIERPGPTIWKGRNPDSVISPAGWGMAAGFSVGLVEGGVRLWVPTEGWKRKLLGASWNCPKVVACRLFVEKFGLLGLDPEVDADQDEIDAIAIMNTAGLYTKAEVKKWSVSWT